MSSGCVKARYIICLIIRIIIFIQVLFFVYFDQWRQIMNNVSPLLLNNFSRLCKTVNYIVIYLIIQLIIFSARYFIKFDSRFDLARCIFSDRINYYTILLVWILIKVIVVIAVIIIYILSILVILFLLTIQVHCLLLDLNRILLSVSIFITFINVFYSTRIDHWENM